MKKRTEDVVRTPPLQDGATNDDPDLTAREGVVAAKQAPHPSGELVVVEVFGWRRAGSTHVPTFEAECK